MTQLPLFPEVNPLTQLDDRVRTTEIGGEVYASILDIFEYHGNKKNPRTAWNTTLAMLEKQGFISSTEIGQHQFEGQGQRFTPVVNLHGFLRLVQSSEVKEWESIRAWLAKTGADTLKAQASKEREHNIDLLKKSGMADTPEGRRYQARHENIETYKALTAVIVRVCQTPNMGQITNAEYSTIFGETAEQLKKLLRTKSIRDSLNTRQIRTLTFAEDMLRDTLAEHRDLTNDDILSIIDDILPPIGEMLKSIMNAQGLDHITGKPLLRSGERTKTQYDYE